jgi:hypothetical protein
VNRDRAVEKLLELLAELPKLVAEAQRDRAALSARRLDRQMPMSHRRWLTADGQMPYHAARSSQNEVDLCINAIGSMVEIVATGALQGLRFGTGPGGRHPKASSN